MSYKAEAEKWARETLAPEPNGAPLPEGVLQRGHRRPGGPAAPAGDATRLFYMSEERSEGKKAYLERAQA